MRSPWEMWVEYYPEIDVVGESFREQQRSTVRYLRADLTCKECAHQFVNSFEACSHAMRVDVPGGVAGALYFTPGDDKPACMAFAPKDRA